MNWFSENKFLAGLIAVVVVGVGAFLFLLTSAKAKYAETAQQYKQQANELQRLQAMKPFPAQESIDKIQEQKQSYMAAAAELRKTLSSMEFEMQAMTPEEFQDKLRATVSEVQALAGEKNVALPADFYLGFPEYQASPPRSEATARLAWQLRTLEFVVKTLINNRVVSVDGIDREPVPGEDGAATAPAEGKSGTQLLERYPFTVTFKADQGRFRTVLNQLSTAKEQFLIVESLVVKNEQTTGPSKQAPGAPPPETVTEEGTPQEAAARLQFILGTEKLEVSLRIAAVDFAEVDAPAKPATP